MFGLRFDFEGRKWVTVICMWWSKNRVDSLPPEKTIGLCIGAQLKVGQVRTTLNFVAKAPFLTSAKARQLWVSDGADVVSFQFLFTNMSRAYM